MSLIKIDGIDYDVDLLSNEAKNHLASIQFVDGEIARLQAMVAALQTARIAYSNELKKHLEGFNRDAITLN